MSGYTGTARFYDFIYGNQADYWVEWVTVFVAGKVMELKLQQWEERNNRERLACEARWNREQEKRERFLATWIGRHLYPPYAWVVHGCFGMPLFKFCHWVASACDHVGRAIVRADDNLAPYGDPIRAERRRRTWSEMFDGED